MMDETMTGDLVRVWITVSDEDGSSHLESRWTATPTAVAIAHVA